MIEQVSIQAHGVGGRFFDLPRRQAVASLAVAFFRVTPQGSRSCILPACSADLVTIWNQSRPKQEKSEGTKAVSAHLMGGN